MEKVNTRNTEKSNYIITEWASCTNTKIQYRILPQKVDYEATNIKRGGQQTVEQIDSATRGNVGTSKNYQVELQNRRNHSLRHEVEDVGEAFLKRIR